MGFWDRETDVEALRARCRTVVKERDAARRERTQLQRKIRRLERDIEALGENTPLLALVIVTL